MCVGCFIFTLPVMLCTVITLNHAALLPRQREDLLHTDVLMESSGWLITAALIFYRILPNVFFF